MTIGAVHFLGNFTANSFLTFLLLIAISNHAYEFAQTIQAYSEYQHLKRFLLHGVLFRCAVKENRPEECVSSETYENLYKMRVVAPINTAPLARIFTLTPLKETQPLGAWKGYIPARAIRVFLPRDLTSVETPLVSPISPGYVFTDTEPQDYDAYDKFKIAHELAHCTNFGIRTKLISEYGLISIVSLVLFAFQVEAAGWLLSALLAYAFVRLMEMNDEYKTAYDEGLADMVAFQNMEEASRAADIIRLHRKYLKSVKSIPDFERRHRNFVCDFAEGSISESGEVTAPAMSVERQFFIMLALAILGLIATFLSVNTVSFFPVHLLVGYIFLKAIIQFFDYQNSREREETETVVQFLLSINWIKLKDYSPKQMHMLLSQSLQGPQKEAYGLTVRLVREGEKPVYLRKIADFLTGRELAEEVRASKKPLRTITAYFAKYFIPRGQWRLLSIALILLFYLFEALQ